ncbi:Acetyltransferase YpeA [Roseovarius litorisediminis]|uniref:Acetyltransferase YpeA n=1 Tax=Roseovarius litorisediminis TaxID=1312363 RepID=A0A1Y5RN18_9RHOB|nr:GNAT family acetyltransferase [Roseovarius litorisediminis]SLN20936.1 Acetyltransferase YpeA [Roseovarius litorisediminis]
MTTDFQPIQDDDVAQVVKLWHSCDLTRPWNPPGEDIAQLRAHPTAEILVARNANACVASVAVGYDGHRGWAYYVATDPAFRNRGLGRAAMRAAEGWLTVRGVAKIQLMVRESNAAVIGFYGGLGYKDSGVRVLQKWLSPERARLCAEGTNGH